MAHVAYEGSLIRKKHSIPRSLGGNEDKEDTKCENEY